MVELDASQKMPIYEYECQACGHNFEALQKISDALLTDCPACNEPQLKKQVTAAAFRLKGGGWYETDFKAGDKKKNLAGEANKASDSKGGSGGSGDSKTGEKKADTKPSASATGSSV